MMIVTMRHRDAIIDVDRGSGVGVRGLHNPW